MIKRYLAIFGLLLMNLPYVLSRPDSYQLLNATVDHVNSHLRYYWLVHKDLVELNRNLNSFFAASKTEMPDWEASSLRMAPIKLIRETPPAFVSELAELTEVQKAQQLHMQSLQQYYQQKRYQEDEGGKIVFALLEQIEENFTDFRRIHREFEQVISPENYRQGLMEDHDPFLHVVQELYQHVQISRNLIIAMQTGQRSELQKEVQALRLCIERSAKRKNPLLQQIEARPGSKHDPGKRYDLVLTQSQALLQQAEQYLGKDPIDPYFRTLGRQYYYYNQFLVNKFSREGESLVHQFNCFLSLHELPLLKALGEPHSFALVSPKPEGSIKMARITQEVPPTHLIFLVDISGSMRQAEKFPLFQRSFLYLLSQLREEDRVSVVSYSGSARVHAEAVSPNARVQLIETIQTLEAEGKTNIQQGMSRAYQLAQDHYIEGGNNRIILVSDGGFTLNKHLINMAQQGEQSQIKLSTLYMGHEEAKAKQRLAPLAARGGGNYQYVESQNAQAVLVREIIKP